MKMTHKSDRVLPPFRFWILTYGSDLAGAQLFPKLNCPFFSLTPGSWGCHPEIPDDSLSSSCTWLHILLLQSPSCCGNKPLHKQDKKVFLAERGMINSLLQKSFTVPHWFKPHLLAKPHLLNTKYVFASTTLLMIQSEFLMLQSCSTII